ncbi:MAG: hypothetical protein AB7F41_02115 [Methylocystis sp.]|uniref:hypothetical protein n=1 Tax=Methylocystis sp. TaxID=1911079 RepID=UPI003D10ABD1
MPARFSALAGAFVMATVVASPSAGFACGFDGALGAGFSAMHPKSLAVAFAISDAVASGVVGRAAAAPIEPGPKGYWRAAGHIQSFERRLAATPATLAQAPRISILFIESRLWSRLVASGQGYDVQMHVAGPTPGDVVIVTNETVLAAALDGALAPRAAFDLGVIAVDAEPPAADAIRAALLSAVSSKTSAAVKAIPFFRRK